MLFNKSIALSVLSLKSVAGLGRAARDVTCFLVQVRAEDSPSMAIKLSTWAEEREE